MKIILELASKTPAFIDSLLDDTDRHVLADDMPPAVHVVSAVVAAPEPKRTSAPARPFSISELSPRLEGRLAL